jgi:hypothetical protein
MVVVEVSEPDRAVVMLVTAKTDDDWFEYVRAVGELIDRNYEDGVVVQVFRRGLEMPSARARKAMSELRGRVPADTVNVVVTPSVVMRMMQTSLDWLRKPEYDSTTHPDFASAVAHVEKVRGTKMPVLAQMLEAASRRERAMERDGHPPM